MNLSRRSFVKSAAAGVAGAAVSGSVFDAVGAQNAGLAWTDKMPINPAIDNLKVVSCKDPNMVIKNPVNWTFSNVNAAVNSAVVAKNLDLMAISLSGATNANDAWAAIFRKPASKTWDKVVVAAKVNCIEPAQMHRLASIIKVFSELNKLGVPFTNMYIYDGCHNASGNGKYNYSGNGLPQGVIVSNGNTSLGGTISSPVPGCSNSNCTKNIANGTVDILINCAVNKGHSMDFSANVTLSMKNHFGTFEPKHDGYNYIIGINKSDAIVGGTPARQQLVIVDSIWAMTYGPTNPAGPNKAPYRLIIGTFGPAVDYVTAKKVRATEMSTSPTNVIENYLPSFGYSNAERDSMKLIEVDPATPVRMIKHDAVSAEVVLSIRTHSGIKEGAKLRIGNAGKISGAAIYNSQGQLVKHLYLPKQVSSNAALVNWDCTDEGCREVNSGTYIFSVESPGHRESAAIKVLR